ncbi:hypothetical protein H310_09858 [Aphanomyces invadans]|uniref:WRKY19-like zinc finger domain-containing protein n=1 Tax=Aphanomyces invadans TaxID=157072 RepID=A0A024TSM7_9STRA|nr:hypothetical protein H310_09858 [Aphanomyces invadans]ETV97023.1 hypothetical protein H310_09858 [Aphanomyces invadans]|eukprot:XP_008874269.1 hypothetical protein H310_09858 [Aphanomyces invadans]
MDVIGPDCESIAATTISFVDDMWDAAFTLADDEWKVFAFAPTDPPTTTTTTIQPFDDLAALLDHTWNAPFSVMMAAYTEPNAWCVSPSIDDWYPCNPSVELAAPPRSQMQPAPHLAPSTTYTLSMVERIQSPIAIHHHPMSTKCVVDGCPNVTPYVRGECKQLHRNKRLCNFDGCPSGPQTGGFCIRHGGGHRCSVDGCNKAVQTKGKCKKHGGGVRCTVDDCKRSSQGDKACRYHGGGKRCVVPGCGKGVQRGGFCAAHGPKRPTNRRRRRDVVSGGACAAQRVCL